jgi:GH15 family glucan-1,4-alpha-glucosidase
MCFPRWDSPSIFTSLIGGDGTYLVRPVGRFVWGGYYEPRSLIWRSRWITEDDVAVESREALALPARSDSAVILRRVVALDGEATVEVVLNPRGGYGVDAARGLTRDDNGCWSGETAGTRFRWVGAGNAREKPDGARGKALVMKLPLAAGETHDFVLALGGDATTPEPDEAWRATESAWKRRVPELTAVAGRRDAELALAVITGLTSSGRGMVAAATTALPERAEAGKNYDYRYAWIRDQCYAGRAAAKAGVTGPVDAAAEFVAQRLLEDGPRLSPAYTAGGGTVPREKKLPLPGYPGADARIGNHAAEQFQLDAFGEALLLFASAASLDQLDADRWRAVETAASAIEARWREDDAGIWETEPRQWTHSRLISAAGLRSISEHANGEAAARWLRLADAIVAEVSASSLHPSGRWQRAADDDRLDASLLLAPLRGAIPPNDPRSIATLNAYLDELTEDGYAYRYRADGAPLGDAEGAFLLCGFIVALAQCQQGNAVEATRWFERNRAACGPSGLLAEEFDVQERQLRGNLPQAFVHALLLETAVAIGR